MKKKRRKEKKRKEKKELTLLRGEAYLPDAEIKVNKRTFVNVIVNSNEIKPLQ